MGGRLLLGMVVTFALAVLPASTFAQAAAESALTTAHSTTATANAGSMLNRALNQSTKQLGGRLQEQTLKPLRGGMQQNQRALKLKSQARAGTVRNDSVPGNVVTSIQGAEATCAPTDLKTQAGGDKTNTESKDKNCRSKDPSLKPGPQDKGKENKYKSAITLSFQK
jgi:hypothetical protein